MKKNLNISYLNGAEGIRRCSVSSGSSGSGSGLKYLPKYYSIDWSVADEGLETVLKNGITRIASTVKLDDVIIAAYSVDVINKHITAFSFLPVGFQNQNTFDVTFLETLESVIDFENSILNTSISMNGIKEISEKEYYSFNSNNTPG